MNTSVSRRGRLRSVRTLLLAAMSPASVLAAEGTIYLGGATVPSPSELTRPAGPASLPARAGSRADAEVVFERQWIDRPSASMTIQPVGTHPPDFVYVDNLGRRRHVEGSSTIAIGRDGGRLSLAQLPSAGRDRPAAALLTVRYD